MELTTVILVIAAGYIIGSFPTAYIVARFKGVDIFKVGSGNMGATNVARACGLPYGILVWAWDGFKGIAAILLARWLIPDHQAAASVVAAVSVIAGHNWSFLASVITGSVRGGKGAATASGTLLLLAPTLLVALILGLAALVVIVTRYVSLAVITATSVAAIAILILVGLGKMDPVYTVYLLAAWMVVLRHRANIYRLISGTERRLGERV